MDLAIHPKGTAPEAGERKKPRRRFKVKYVVIALVLLAVAAGIATGVKLLFFSAERAVALTETTTYGTLATTIEGTGTTMPADSISVTAASNAAEITAVYVSAGDTVAAGDPLYTQDDSELDDQIADYQDQIAELEEELASAYDQRASIQETLAALTVTAPFSGHITEAAVREGDTVQKGSRLAVLVDDGRMTLTEYFSYAYEDQVCLGMSAGVSIADLALNLSGTVTDIQKVERYTGQGTRCFAVTVTVDNPGALTEGMGGAGYLLSAAGEKIYPAIEGTFQYNAAKTLTAGASGELTAVKAIDYQKVSAGDILFVVDGSDYESQLTAADKKIAQTNEKIAALQEKIAEAGERRDDYIVTASIPGKIIMVNVREGEVPRQGITAVSIYNLDTMTITANIDELDIGSIEMGMDVAITASSGESYRGAVTAISYEATNANGVAYFPITIEIASDGGLSAGVNVSYTIHIGDAEEGILVPVAALKNTDEGACVFVKAETRPENAVELEEGTVPDGFYAVPVEVGTVTSRYARVLSGVEAGAEVFTRYQNTAPSGGSATSESQEEEFTFPGGDFSGGQMPDFSGGGSFSGGGGRGNMGGGTSGNMGGMTPPG